MGKNNKWQIQMDEDAERAVLSSVLQDGDFLYSALSVISELDFISPRHRLVFTEMVALSQEGEVVDILTLAGRLRNQGKLDEVGGIEYLSELEGCVPTPHAITHFSRLIKKKSILRMLANIGDNLLQSAMSGEDADDLINIAQNKIYNASLELQGIKSGTGVLGPQEIASSAFDSAVYWMENQGEARGLQTGFIRLDSIINGLKDVNIISASTGVGKTAFALNLALKIGVGQSKPVLYCNHEMNIDEVTVRMQGILSGIPINMVLKGRYNDMYPFAKITEASQRLSAGNIFITDNAPKNINAVIALIRKYKSQHNIEAVIVDYLGEIDSDRIADGERSEYLTYGRWAQQLKNACVTIGVKLVLLAQLNREGDESPSKNKVAGSWKIAQKADVFMILGVDGSGRHFLKIDKNRNGPAPVTIDLEFDKDTQRISERA